MAHLSVKCHLLRGHSSEAQQLALHLSALVLDLSCHVDDLLSELILPWSEHARQILDLVCLVADQSAQLHVLALEDLITL